MLTSNPWNYLDTWLNNEINGIKKRTERMERLEKSKYFLALAQDFQVAADFTKLPAKGTLTYYSILNLIKVFLLLKGTDLEKTHEHHGLTLPSGETKILKTTSQGNDTLNIFAKFCELIGNPINSGDLICLDEMISEIPEVHEMVFNIGKLTTNKRKFLPIEIDILTNTPKRSFLICEIKYDKKHEKIMQVSKFKSGVLQAKLKACGADKNWIIYKTKERINYTNDSDRSWKSNYKRIQDELITMGVAVILTRAGYRYYLNLQPQAHRPLVYYVALMYYIGAVARYRPTLYNDVLAGEYQAVLNETLETCPSQFLYYMASLITGKVCAVPMAKL